MTIEQALAWIGSAVGVVFGAGTLWQKVANLEDDVKEVKEDVKDLREHLLGSRDR